MVRDYHFLPRILSPAHSRRRTAHPRRTRRRAEQFGLRGVGSSRRGERGGCRRRVFLGLFLVSLFDFLLWKGKGKRQTLSRPHPIPPLNLRSNLLNFKPNIPSSVPRINILAIRHARHIKMHGTNMLHRCLELEPHGRTRGYVADFCDGSPGFFVAAESLAVDVGHGLVRPFVGRAPHVFPFEAFLVVGEEVGECVCIGLGHW